MAAENKVPSNCGLCAHQLDGATQSLLVAFGIATRRAVRPQLPKRQVAAEHR